MEQLDADYVLKDITTFEPLKNSICRLINDKHFEDDDLIIVLAGSFGDKQGASYIEISTAGNLKQKCV